MTSVINYFKGVLIICLYSSARERFFNICNANKIEIWGLHNEGDKCYFNLYARDYFKLKSILKKTGSRVRIVKKSGLPFVLFHYRKHNCFLAGIYLSLILIYSISLFVWDIRIVGNIMIIDDVLMDALNTFGIKHGILIKNISCDETEKYLRNNFDDLTWVSVEINGTRLVIYVKENDEDYIVSEKYTQCNLIASKSGVIKSIITRSGTPMVKPGDEVSEGDILVSGIVNVYDDYGTVLSSKQVAADADILIETDYEYNDKLDSRYNYKLMTGKSRKNYYVEVFGKIFQLGFSNDFEYSDCITNDNHLKLNDNFYMPVHFGTIEYDEYKKENARYTETEAKVILDSNLEYFLKVLGEKGVQIISKDVKMYKDVYSFTYNGKIHVLENAYIRADINETEESMGELNERN